MPIQAHTMPAAPKLRSRRPAPQISASQPQPRPRRVARPPNGLRCPHCGGDRCQGHGSFPLQDGTRQPRYRCLACERTFNPQTGTPVAYLKKRDRWERLAECMAKGLSVRRTAAALGVQVATAFRWRHRLLSAVAGRPLPALTGPVAAGEAFIRYSEKGSWGTGGPGARGGRRAPGRRLFRRFVDGKPSRVLLACAREQQVAVIAGRGRPAPGDLEGCLKPVLGAGVELCISGEAPYAEACRRLGVAHREAWGQRSAGLFAPLLRKVDWLRLGLYVWLRRFHGVATRYVHHYLSWYLFKERTSRLEPGAAGCQLLAEAGAVLPSGRPARQCCTA